MLLILPLLQPPPFAKQGKDRGGLLLILPLIRPPPFAQQGED